MTSISKISQPLEEIFESVKVIGFDLDDTLWDNRPIILAAIDAQYQYLAEQLPNIARAELEAVYTVRVEELVAQSPDRYQDMTELRQQALYLICEHYGLSRLHAETAFAEFFKARQKVILFAATQPLLTLLQSRFQLIAISNGNASLSDTPIANFFEFHWRAGVNGRAKPDKDMLVKACDYFSIEPNQLLYVGDHVKYDYLAAKNAGAHSIVISDEAVEPTTLQFNDLNSFLLAAKNCLVN